MSKLRVYQLARELNRDNSEMIRELQHMGVPVTSHSNTVEDRLADALRKKLGVYEEEPVKAKAKEAAAPPEEEIKEVHVEVPIVDNRNFDVHLFYFFFRRCGGLFRFCFDRLFFIHTEFFAERVRETVFYGVGMRGDRHTHVLQFANHLGVVA